MNNFTKPSHSPFIYERLAFGLSVVLHPLLLPSLTFYIFLYVHPIHYLAVREEAKWALLLVIFILTFLAPMMGILVFYLTGGIKSLELKDSQDRHLPFVLTTFFYAVSTWLFLFAEGFKVLPILGILIGSTTLSIALVTIITFFWKISAHSTGITGVLGFLFGMSYKLSDEGLLFLILVLILLAGLLMSARLYLNAHTPAQILAGCLLGFTLNFCAIIFLL